jgi:UPF0271 protein
VFADRGYTAAGTLVPRGTPGAMLYGEAAVSRLLDFLESGTMPVVGGGSVALAVDSVCIHGDSPESVALAQAVKAGFAATGVKVSAFAA